MIARSVKLVLHGALGAGLLAAGLSSAAAAETKAAILLPGSINDQSWNALGYSILQSLKPHGFTTAYSENVADADEAEALRGYANQGYSIVMGHSGRFVSAMEQVGPEFPKTQFIAVSGNEGMAPTSCRLTGTMRSLAANLARSPPR
jgi:basic membrane protein A and related proteins